MANKSKADVRAEIRTLAQELGAEVQADLDQIDKMDLLQPILDGLLARKGDKAGSNAAGSEAVGPAGTGTPTTAAPELPKAEPKPKRFRYEVAPGKTVITPRGPMGALQQVRVTDFAGGQDALAKLVKDGFVMQTEYVDA